MAKIKEDDNNVFDSMLVHKATPEYLQDLLKDKKQLQNFPNIFLHLEIILEKEIARVREKLFHLNESYKRTENELPEPVGVVTTLQEKVFVPIKENPNYNFVGRLLGPRGLTAKQLEQDLECKIMVRGKGSLRDKKKEDMNKGKPNWEHLEEDLHVLVSVEDYENRASIKLRRATETIRQFLEQGLKTPENEDRLKQLQLMELAVLNDKDRQQAQVQQLQQQQQQQQQQQFILQQQSMAVLNNQAAIAAAAQLLQPAPAIPPSQLIVRLHNQTSTIGASNLQLNATTPGSVTAAANSPLTMTAGNMLNPYLNSSSLNNVLGTIGCGSVPNGSSGPVGLGLSLAQLQNTATSLGLPTPLSFTVPAGLQNPVQSNFLGCNPNSDQFSAVAAALLAGSTNPTSTGNNVQFDGVKVALPTSTYSKSSTSLYHPMTSLPSQFMHTVNMLDYSAAASNFGQEHIKDSLKMRNVQSSSGQNRMHPYLR